MAETPNYKIDYDDPQFQELETDQKEAELDAALTYGNMISGVDNFYKEQSDLIGKWNPETQKFEGGFAGWQMENQQAQTDFAIEQINQQKEQAEKDYKREQSGAYVDWQKQSNQYGVEAERTASAGLSGTGYSESSQVSMYNTYQNRVATARESFNRAVLNYDNAIKDAILQNSVALAQIAEAAFSKQLELAIEGYNYHNQLVLDYMDRKTEIDNNYWQRQLALIQQQNTENALAEDVRQYNETMKWNTEQAELNRQHDIALAEIKHNYDKALAKIEQQYKLDYLKAQTDEEKKLLKIQHENDIAKLNQQLANEKALLKYQYDLQKTQTTPITGGGGSRGSSSGGSGYSAISGGINRNSKNKTAEIKDGDYRDGVYAVNTAYYKGDKNPDAHTYGTFSNGYQPKGISGHGKLRKQGKTIELPTQTLSGQKQTVIQNIWIAEDGTTWYWEGRQNKYINIPQDD